MALAIVCHSDVYTGRAGVCSHYLDGAEARGEDKRSEGKLSVVLSGRFISAKRDRGKGNYNGLLRNSTDDIMLMVK